MQPACLLQPADPLPPLPCGDGQLLRGDSWPGQWALLLLAPRDQADQALRLASATLAVAVCPSEDGSRAAQWAQRLAAVPSLGGAGLDGAGLAVLVEPRGTVAGAWCDPDAARALHAAHAFWLQASGGR